MPALDTAFRDEAKTARELATSVELARLRLPTARPSSQFRLMHVELVYELAYLRMMNAWEIFLEQAFLRYCCGYAHSGGVETPKAGRHHTRIADARAAVYGTWDFLLWHDPTKVVKRIRGHLTASTIETVVASATADLEHYSTVRHRIAHGQDHAKREFDRTAMALAGRRYRGARPGRFLRDWSAATASTPKRRWLDHISVELAGLAAQIIP